MSDTPETDAQLTTFSSISKLGKRFKNKTGTVGVEFARKLERERDQARRELHDLLESIQILSSTWGKHPSADIKQPTHNTYL